MDSVKPQNLIIIMADEHAGAFTSYAGHKVVKTPNLNRLAAKGTWFRSAYCNSPICMPARASFVTGQYPHDTGYVCNATPYDGRVKGWPHRLSEAGVPVTSIGKLHYRDADVNTGFDRTINPMHAVGGVGDIFGAIRQSAPLPVRYGVKQVAEQVGRGESDYTRYDRQILSDTLDWLKNEAPNKSEPWVLFVSFVCPHFPLIAPDEFHALYDPETMALPKAHKPEDWPKHPWFEAFRASYITDQFFDDDLRRQAVASYLGLISFIDDQLGQIMDAVDAGPVGENTRMIYTSDHGDNLGARGLWQKSNFYEESAQVPLIISGQGIPEGKVCGTPVSLIDFHTTILHATGVSDGKPEVNPDAASLIDIARAPNDETRTVFGEYHAAGAVNGVFMLRQGPWKYIHYANMPEQLYNLETDPEELHDLAGDLDHAEVLNRFRADLMGRLDPVAVDAKIKALQLDIVESHGGREAVLSKGSMGASPPPGTRFEGTRTD